MASVSYNFDGSNKAFNMLSEKIRSGNRIIYIVQNGEIKKYAVIKGRAQWLKMIWEWLYYRPDEGKYVISNRKATKLLRKQIKGRIDDLIDSKNHYKRNHDGKKFLATIQTFSRDCLKIVDREVNQKISHLLECTQCLGELSKAETVVKEAKSLTEINNVHELKRAINYFLQLSYIKHGMHPQYKKFLSRSNLEKGQTFDRFADEKIAELQKLIKDYYFSHLTDVVSLVSKDELKEGLLSQLLPEHNQVALEKADEALDKQLNFLRILEFNAPKFRQLVKMIRDNTLPIGEQVKALSLLERFDEALDGRDSEFEDEFKQVEILYQKVWENFEEKLRSFEEFFSGFDKINWNEEELNQIEDFARYFSLKKYNFIEGTSELRKLQGDIAKLNSSHMVMEKMQEIENIVKQQIIERLESHLEKKQALLEIEKAQQEKIEEKIADHKAKYHKKIDKLALSRNPHLKDKTGKTLFQQVSPSFLFEENWNCILRILQIGLEAKINPSLSSDVLHEFNEVKKELKRSELDDLEPRNVLGHRYFKKLVQQIQNKLYPYPGITIEDEWTILLDRKAVQRYMDEYNLRPYELADMEQTKTMTLNMKQVHVAMQLLRADPEGPERLRKYVYDQLAKGLEKFFLGFELEKEISEIQIDEQTLLTLPKDRMKSLEKEVREIKLMMSGNEKMSLQRNISFIRDYLLEETQTEDRTAS